MKLQAFGSSNFHGDFLFLDDQPTFEKLDWKEDKGTNYAFS